ncbi:hypothetical protein, partial [Escherichia sp. E1130]|uniref:hypothetical protein n=1 Tax=Escherichia sp. E1130 TaxID=2041645 RepID=UPI00197F33E7
RVIGILLRISTEKSKKMLDSVAGKAYYAHPRAAEKKAKRHCSLTIYQTICVGTRRYGFLTSQDDK